MNLSSLRGAARAKGTLVLALVLRFILSPFQAADSTIAHAAAPQSSGWQQELVNRTVASTARQFGVPVVVGVIDRGHVATYGFGGKSVNGDTVFETASLSKVFSGLILAQMIEQGKVSKDEAVDALLGRKMAHYGGKPITLYQLATHTSGLPLFAGNRAGTTSPYSTASLENYASTYHLPSTPGSTMIYSNVGYALLGDALAQKAGEPSYESLLQHRVCEPLGMHDTHVDMTSSMCSRLVHGHANGGQARSSCPTGGGGADGVRSTANDLLKLLSAYIGATKTNFGPALHMSMQSYESVDDTTDGGFAWYHDKPTGIVWKGGLLAGYRTFIAFSPTKHTGVVVLAASSSFPSPQLGKKLLARIN